MSRAAWRRRLPRRLALGALLLVATCGIAVAALASTADRSSASGLPTIGFSGARFDRVEGASGPALASLTVNLSAASATTVSAQITTSDGTATVADGDYVARSQTVLIAPGVRTATVTVTVNGDTKLEDYQSFRAVLSSPTNAVLGRSATTVWILNDEHPQVAMSAVRAAEGAEARLRPHLVQRYFEAISASIATANGSATAPADYTSTVRSFTFPAGSKAAVTTSVPTATDALTEGTETFSATVDGPAIVNRATATASILEQHCPQGTGTAPGPAAAPASPSGPLLTGPPDAVTGGATWDLMFRDEFDDTAATAARWSNGMREGAQTLEGNRELQWYVPENSTLTTDSDGTRTVSVLRQRLTASPVTGQYYAVGTLSRVYPPARCPSLYDPAHLGSGEDSNVPYQFRSGMLNSAKSFGFRYGYVEARVRMPRGFALWPALWLRDWQPWSYEIDALEGFDRDARLVRSSYWWGNGSSNGTDGTGGDLGLTATGTCRGTTPLPATSATPTECSLANALDLAAGYHTIGLNWTATKYEIFLDGVKRWSSPSGANVASAYHHLIINLALGNNDHEFDWNQETIRPLDPSVLASGAFPKPTVEWDYVKVWQAPGSHDVCTSGTC
ncbi:MAG: Calx-beta domain-containing protein [Actinomycetes bacterium]